MSGSVPSAFLRPSLGLVPRFLRSFPGLPSGAGRDSRPAAVPGDPLAVAADLTGAPAAAVSPGGVEIQPPAVVALALAQQRAGPGVGEQFDGVAGDEGEQGVALGGGGQLPDEAAASSRTARSPGGGPAARALTSSSARSAARPATSALINSATYDRSSVKACSQSVPGTGSGCRPGRARHRSARRRAAARSRVVQRNPSLSPPGPGRCARSRTAARTRANPYLLQCPATCRAVTPAVGALDAYS